jgi:hypothetical protein
MDWLIWVAVVVGICLVVLATASIIPFARKRRTAQLRDAFGSEYDRAIEEYGSKERAELELQRRRERVGRLRLRALDADERQRFLVDWTATQAQFVDDPRAAVDRASSLVDDAMKARGFPVAEFDRRVEDISAEHPYVVEHYRAAREYAHGDGAGKTEDLRQAMVHYRELFNELLNAQEPGQIPQPSSRARPQQPRRAS